MSNSVYINNKELTYLSKKDLPELDDDQIDAADHMHQVGSHMLLSEPGAGKTITALDALARVEFSSEDNDEPQAKVLVLCPPIALFNWARWITTVYDAIEIDSKVQLLTAGSATLHDDTTHAVVPYSVISRKGSKLTSKLFRPKWTVLIADESDNLTGTNSNRTNIVFGASRMSGLVDNVKWRWFLTGTPIPRYQDGLWPVLSECFSKRLREFGINGEADFMETFCYTKKVRYGRMTRSKTVVSGSKNRKLMNKLLYDGAGRVATRLKTPLRNEPTFRDVSILLKPSPELQKINDDVEHGINVDDYGVQLVDPNVSKGLRLLGVEAAPAVAKYVVDKIAIKRNAGDKRGILLLFWHTDVGKLLQKELEAEKLNTVRIDGATPNKDRDAYIQEFNDGYCDVMIGQTKSMGVAVDLQWNCNHVVFAEDTFSSAMNEQAWRRVARRGQTSTVLVDTCTTQLYLSNMRSAVAARKDKEARDAVEVS